MRLFLILALTGALSFHPFDIAGTPERKGYIDDGAVFVGRIETPLHGKTPDSARALARLLATPYDWDEGKEWKCLDRIWYEESRWEYDADNPYSSAYGIPQILKLPEHLSPRKQIERGLRYIESRYGTPCEAWDFWQSNYWY